MQSLSEVASEAQKINELRKQLHPGFGLNLFMQELEDSLAF